MVVEFISLSDVTVTHGRWIRIAAMVPNRNPKQSLDRHNTYLRKLMVGQGPAVYVVLRHTMIMCIFKSMICVGGEPLRPNGTVATAPCPNHEVRWDPVARAYLIMLLIN